jgi:hypothetical protein
VLVFVMVPSKVSETRYQSRLGGFGFASATAGSAATTRDRAITDAVLARGMPRS